MATYVNDLRLTELATGEGSGTWGTTTNTSLELIGEALGYATQQAFGSDADATTTVADGASDPARAMYYKITSAASLTATRTLTIAPNTISRVMFIENATSGSQSIAISQGSGASVTIATGKTAVVYLDGAGATAAVVDAMAGVDPGVTDTLTEVLVAGNTSGGTNIELSTTDKVQFRDAAIYLNSSVDGQLDIVADTEIQIAATTIDINGAINASGEIIAASLDISGDIDVDGTTNLDVVDIDGAVDMASTLALGSTIATGQTSFSGGSILLDLHGSGSGTGSQASFYNDHNTSGFQIGLAGNTSGDVTFYNVANTDTGFVHQQSLTFDV
jgi:cytoskeletal protein CcmA (bactofilin family)